MDDLTFSTFNPLTPDDALWHCQFLATCYHVQSVLKIGSALAERVGQGEVGGNTPLLSLSCNIL